MYSCLYSKAVNRYTYSSLLYDFGVLYALAGRPSIQAVRERLAALPGIGERQSVGKVKVGEAGNPAASSIVNRERKAAGPVPVGIAMASVGLFVG